MNEELIQLGGKKKSSTFMDKVKEILPEGGNLNLCLTCGACSSGCPATGLDGMDPRKFLRMAALGLDDEIAKSDWPWMCTMCQRRSVFRAPLLRVNTTLEFDNQTGYKHENGNPFDDLSWN